MGPSGCIHYELGLMKRTMAQVSANEPAFDGAEVQRWKSSYYSIYCL